MILRTTIGAFFHSKETGEAIEALKEDRLFLRSSFDVQEGGIDKAAAHLSSNPTPQLLIVESKAQGDQLYGQLNKLAEVCAPNTFVVLIGVQNDIGLYRELILEGISDYLVGPVNTDQLKTSIANIYKDVEERTGGRVIAFMGVAGGVGSSVISHNVAYELAKTYEMDTILLDLDLSYGTAALDFNLQPRQTIVDALTQISRLDEAILDQYLAEYEDKLSILTSPASLSIGLQLSAEPINAVLAFIKRMADFVILDVPHGWDPWVREVLSEVEELILISRPDLTNLRNAKNMVEFLGSSRGADSRTRLVLNKVGAAKRSNLSVKDFKDALALDPAISIPYDPEGFGRALNNGEMMSKASAKSKATIAIIELAKIVSTREEEEEEKKGIFSMFKKDKKDNKDKNVEKD